MAPSDDLAAAVEQHLDAHRRLQEAVHEEPWDAWSLESDGDRAAIVIDVATSKEVDGFSWRADPGIWGEPIDAGLRIWITEDTGHAGDRSGGPNHWLVHLRFTERTTDRLRQANAAAQDAIDALHAALVVNVDTLQVSMSGGSSGDLSWLRLMPPGGTGDGRSWEASPSLDGTSVVISFIEDARGPGERIGPAPITGMAWVNAS